MGYSISRKRKVNGGKPPFFLGEALPTQDTIRQNNNCLGMNQNEAAARVHIDAQLKPQGPRLHLDLLAQAFSS